MQHRKPYLLPVWVLGGTLLFRIFLLIHGLLIRGYTDQDQNFTRALFFAGIWILVIIAQIIFYWVKKTGRHNRVWIQLHVWLLFIALGMIPVLISAVLAIAIRNLGPAQYLEFIHHIQPVQLYLFWILIGMSHIFFIATIVKSFSKEEKIMDESSADLLDEFTG